MPEKSTLYRFQERLRAARQGGRKVDISFLLDEAKEATSPEDYVRWLEQLLVWVRMSGGSNTSPQTSLKFLLSKIKQNPGWEKSSAAIVQQLLFQGSFVGLFSDTGVHSNYDFVRELIDRLVRRFFPAYGDLSRMDIAVGRIFHDQHDADWVAALLPELRQQIQDVWLSDANLRKKIAHHLTGEVAEACSFLCVRLSAVAIQREILERSGKQRAIQIPPLRLRAHIESYFGALLAGRDESELKQDLARIAEEIAHSRRYLEDVRAHLEHFGVSVGIVFSLEAAHSIIDRIELLLKFSRWLCLGEKDFDPWQFFALFLRHAREEKRISPLVKSNFHLLSRKIVEKSGATGENYITGTPEEYQAMFFAAAGGGFLTAFTAILKYAGPSHLPPFVLGLYAALNYSGSFILMHHLHFKLATKQPAMTAAALAERLRSQSSELDLRAFIDLVARISRSQFAAVAGNIMIVAPTALALDLLWKHSFGHSIVSAEYAPKILESIHPFASLTVLYAAFTGVLLWFSGVFSGWLENAFVYYKIPWAIESHPFLVNLAGAERLHRFTGFVSRNLTGWSSSIALGFALAFVPVAGSFFGLPLDARHVTLSTGAVSLSIGALGWNAITGKMIAFSALGILLIGAMNFGVSFVLALHVAMKANDIPKRKVRAILAACGQEFLKRPKKFFLP